MKMISMKTRDMLVVYPCHNTSLRGRRGAPRLNEHSFPLPRRAARTFTSIAIGFPVAMPNGPLAACLGSYPPADLIVRAF